MPISPLRQKRLDAAFLLALAACLGFLVWRAPMGFAGSDEAFYLTVPYRLAAGDALLADEWHVSQLAGFLLLPAVRLYQMFSGGTEGILLFSRFLCVAAQTLCALYVYLRLRKAAPYGAAAAALLFLLYVPFNISALSYNSMGLMLMGAACVTAAAAKTHMQRDMVLAGLLFAGAVLCCPHLVIVYALYCASVLLPCCFRRGTASKGSPLALRSWLFFSAGAAALAAVFFIFVLSRSDLRTLVNSVLVILNDPEHPKTPLPANLLAFFDSVLFIHRWALPVMCGCAALLVGCLLDRESRGRRRWLYVSAAAILCAVFFAPFLVDGLTPLYYSASIVMPRYVNYLMYPLNILGLFAYVLSRQRNNRLFAAVYIPGMLYGLCVHLASNQRFTNIASVAAVSLLASAVFIVGLISELWAQGRRGRLTALLPALLLMVQLTAQLSFRCSFVYDEQVSFDQLTHTIAYGPEKGLRTTEEKAALYYSVYEDTQPIREKTDGPALYFSKMTWLYLADRKPSAAYSAWMTFEDPENALHMLSYYWLVNPEREPKYVFVSSDFSAAADYARRLDPQGLPIRETPCGYIIGP